MENIPCSAVYIMPNGDWYEEVKNIIKMIDVKFCNNINDHNANRIYGKRTCSIRQPARWLICNKSSKVGE